MIIELTQKKEIELIQFVNDITTENLTVLEKMYVDVDNDGKDESIELFTSAKRGARMEKWSGMMVSNGFY